MTPLTIRRKVSFQHNRHGEKVIAPAPTVVPKGRIPRVAKLLALAHRFNQLIRDGVATDYADLARLGHVTRGRMTQIMNLLNLAPEIQEEILLLPPIHSGKDKVTERSLRCVTAEIDWQLQRQKWNDVRSVLFTSISS